MVWTTLEKDIITHLKNNEVIRKDFIKYCAQNYDVHLINIFHSTTGVQQMIYEKWAKINPNYGDQLLNIARGWHIKIGKPMPYKEIEAQYNFTIKLHQRYWEKITSKYIKLKDSNKLPIPTYYTYTKRILELISRGCISNEDAKNKNYLITSVEGIIYPLPSLLTIEEQKKIKQNLLF